MDLPVDLLVADHVVEIVMNPVIYVPCGGPGGPCGGPVGPGG